MSKDEAALLSRASGENDDFAALTGGGVGVKASFDCASREDEDCSRRAEAASLAAEDFSWSGTGLKVAGERTWSCGRAVLGALSCSSGLGRD